MSDTIVKTPTRIIGLYDKPMWESIDAKAMKLQRCKETGTFQYPPGPNSPDCLSGELEWAPISGKATIISWVIFHRHYLPAYPPPYNAIAVRLEEGPIMISNLEGETPAGSWIGRAVKLVYVTMPDGVVLPRFELTDAG
jgi:uncharacterized OB-fold protein